MLPWKMVEVAALSVFTAANGAEYPDGHETVGLDSLLDLLGFPMDGVGWFHAGSPLVL